MWTLIIGRVTGDRACTLSVACSPNHIITYSSEEDHARHGWTTSRRGQDSPWKSQSEWVLDKAAVKKELLDTVKARKLAYYGHTMRKQGSCLEKR